MDIKERAVIRRNRVYTLNEAGQWVRGTWEVYIGVARHYKNQCLACCIDFCDNNNIPIRNREEVNKVLSKQMPTSEMME